MPPMSLTYGTWVEIFDQNTETYVESKFESNPILTLIREILI